MDWPTCVSILGLIAGGLVAYWVSNRPEETEPAFPDADSLARWAESTRCTHVRLIDGQIVSATFAEPPVDSEEPLAVQNDDAPELSTHDRALIEFARNSRRAS